MLNMLMDDYQGNLITSVAYFLEKLEIKVN